MKELNGTASAPPKKKADKKKYAEADGTALQGIRG